MPIWVFILIVFGGLLLIGIIVDIIMKFRGKKINPERKNRKVTESERIYAESFKEQVRNNMHDNFF
ncbi:hypothetical protein CIL03_18165 [Virgibacillus indicus]|uniref:Uncharacterized protein n=1 Tax=Virgibacillus indicus TaxID=2024554 RepID=A0A265N504_9BACI|nr:hypothetical protein [Virgibacillus indicus]OZU87112.1 hypothetical protein CIL03_18165 [Virgibacillus indicus]